MSMSLLSTPLASPHQLSNPPSTLSGIPLDLAQLLIAATSRLLQSTGILLSLPQPTIATSIILLQRFYLTASISTSPLTPTALASIYLASKLTEHPQKPRDIINVWTYLLSPAGPYYPPSSSEKKDGEEVSPETYYVPESQYTTLRSQLLHQESLILRALGFQTTINLPYTLAFNYLQSLGVLPHTSDPSSSPDDKDPPNLHPRQHSKLISTVFAYLNDYLLSPSYPYLTHHPHELAVAAIYLAARNHAVKLPMRWWEVWDVDRETLGFLVVVARAGCYELGKVWVVEEGEFVYEGGDGGEDGEGRPVIVAIGQKAVEREVRRRLEA